MIVVNLILFDCVNDTLASFNEKGAIILELAPKSLHFISELVEFRFEFIDFIHDSFDSVFRMVEVLH